MNASSDAATRRSADVDNAQSESTGTLEKRTRPSQLPIIPPVDIFEDTYRLTVRAEMPGVTKESLNVQADRNNLLIEGEVALDLPAGMSALYADLQTTKYRRSFLLSGELETESISANLKDGLLTVRIPKRAQFRPRKIKVDVG